MKGYWEEWEKMSPLEKLGKVKELKNIYNYPEAVEKLGESQREETDEIFTQVLNGYFEDLQEYLIDKEDLRYKKDMINLLNYLSDKIPSVSYDAEVAYDLQNILKELRDMKKSVKEFGTWNL